MIDNSISDGIRHFTRTCLKVRCWILDEGMKECDGTHSECCFVSGWEKRSHLSTNNVNVILCGLHSEREVTMLHGYRVVSYRVDTTADGLESSLFTNLSEGATLPSFWRRVG